MLKKITFTIKALCLLVVLCLGGFLFALSNQVAGFRAFVVLSGSMEPTLKVGSLVITKLVSPNDLGPLDIITFVHPQNPKEFITHRILNSNRVGNVPVFKTMGDNNPGIDGWSVVGGSVVGKVVFSVPYAGYIISVTRGKLAIVLLIILPSVFLISEEIRNIFRLLKSSRTNSTSVIAVVVLLLLATSLGATVRPTHAVLSDQVSLQSNFISVLIPTSTPGPSPTSTPTPSPTVFPTPTLSVTPTLTVTPTPKCPGNTTIEISGNGAGSVNEVVVTSNCTTTINQNSSLNSVIEVNSTSTTGGNTSSQNSSTTTISTSSSTSSVSITTSP